MNENFKITIISPENYTYGSMVLGGVLKDAGYNVNLQKGFPEKGISDVVLISLQSTIHIVKYAEEIKKIKAFKILGGPVTQGYDLVLKHLPVDIVLFGEGEVTILPLLEHLKKNKDLSRKEILNTLELEKVNKHLNVIKGNQASLEGIMPFIPPDIASENVRGANVYIETHRGCPGNCGFCQVPCFFGRKVRSKPAPNIVNEVKEFLKNGARRIAISGGTGSLYGSPKFNQVDEKAFNNLLKEISDLTDPSNLTIPDIRVDMINDDILSAINKYTNKWIYFGIESGSDSVLRKMKKGIKVDQIRDAVNYARKFGLKIAGSFIVGYPGEDEEDFEATLELADELMLDDYFISIAEPIPGTLLAEDICKISLEDNPLFIKGEKYKKYDLSILEENALEFMLESYIYRSMPQAMSDNLFKALLQEVKSQGDHIKKVTELISNQEKN